MKMVFRWILFAVIACVCMLECAAAEAGAHEDVQVELESRSASIHVCTSDAGYCDAPTVCFLCGREHSGLIYIRHHETYVDIGEKHQIQCSVCDYVGETRSHEAYCDNPTVCYLCGRENLSDPWIEHVDKLYVNLGEMHKLTCGSCGYDGNPESHSIYCDKPTECRYCDLYNETLEPNGHIGVGFVDLGTEHQEYCTTCGKEWEAEEHWGRCDEPTTCMTCNIENVTVPEGNVGHSGYYESTETECWFVCTKCGNEEAPKAHYASCDTPATCRNCGNENVTIEADYIMHLNIYCENIGTEHREKCTCGYEGKTGAHWVGCTAPTECLGCGGSNILTEKIIHQGGGTFVDLGENHKYSCPACDIGPVEAHYFVEGVCMACGHVNDLPGDADNSTGVTTADALAVLKFFSRGEENINTSNADVNDDDAVDMQDALLLLQYAAGWDVTLK